MMRSYAALHKTQVLYSFIHIIYSYTGIHDARSRSVAAVHFVMENKNLVFILITLTLLVNFTKGNYFNINLPEDHVKYFFNYFPAEAEKCRDDVACPYKVRRFKT